MNLEQCMTLLRSYAGQPDVAIIDAIAWLVSEEPFLSNVQRQEVHDRLWLMAWDSTFIRRLPHDRSNPGTVADFAKSKFCFTGMSMEIARLTVRS